MRWEPLNLYRGLDLSACGECGERAGSDEERPKPFCGSRDRIVDASLPVCLVH